MARRSHLAVAAVALAAAACSRNLDLPAANPVAVSPSTATVAPRETLQLTASGGTGGYRFAFAPGGQLSGPDATIDTATGLYRAGALGPAQDVLVVSDAGGRSAEARVTVGQPLVASPFVVVTAPGGGATVFGAGGKPPYAFSLVDAQALSSLTAAPDGLSASYRAGPLGDRVETVEVRDRTYDPADPARAVASATIRVGAAVKVYANTPGTVAPFEAVEFLAVGGQPPYTFLFQNAPAGGGPPSGGTVDATGHYEAGALGSADGSVFDEVAVRDAFGQLAEPIRITVGAPLSLSLPVVRLSPFVAAGLVAAGGKPPYDYGFDVRGNRSAGTVDAVTGRYVPGDAQGANDVLAVTDATGRARATLRAPAIGFRDLYVGSSPRRSLEARLRGEFSGSSSNPVQDVLVFRWAFTSLIGVTSVFFPRGMDPSVDTGYTPQAEGEPFALDLDADRQDELVVFRPGRVARFDPDLTGALAFESEAAVTALPSTFAVARSPDTTRFLTTAGCAGGLVEVDLARTPIDACVAGPTPSATSLAAGDFDGDGRLDLASVVGNTVGIAYGNGGGGFDPFVTIFLPAGCASVPSVAPRSAAGLVAAGSSDPADAIPRIHVPLTCTSGGSTRAAVARLDARARGALAWSPAAPVDLGRTAGPSIAAYRAGPSTGAILAAWDLASSSVTSVAVDPSGVATVFDPLPGPLDAGLQWVSFPDVDGDGAPDLFAAGIADSAYVLLGDGDGRFGRRARFGGLANATSLDVDRDGLSDLVAVAGDAGITVLFGGDHQLARGPTTATAESVGVMASGDFGAGYDEVVFQGRTAAFYRARIDADGRLGPEQRLSTTVPGRPTTPLLTSVRRAQLRLRPGADAWGTVLSTPSSTAAVLLLDSATEARLLLTLLPAAACTFVPVGSGDATAPADLVSACVSGNDLVLRRASYSDPTYGSWTPIYQLAGAPGAAAQIAAAGRDAGGTGYFVGAPAGAADRDLVVISVKPGPGRTDPFTVATQVLGPATAVPGKAALLTEVDEDPAGGLDLVLTQAGRGQIFRGTSVGGVLSFAAGPRFTAAASGVVSGSLKLAPGTGRDLLVRLGDYFLVLRNAGGASFE